MAAIKSYTFPEGGWDANLEPKKGLRGKLGSLFGKKDVLNQRYGARPPPKANQGHESDVQHPADSATSTGAALLGPTPDKEMLSAHAHLPGFAAGSIAMPSVNQRGVALSADFQSKSLGMQAAELAGVRDVDQPWKHPEFTSQGAGVVEDYFRRYASPAGSVKTYAVDSKNRVKKVWNEETEQSEDIVLKEEFNCADGWFLVHKYTANSVKGYDGHAYLICVIYKKVVTRHILKVPFPSQGTSVENPNKPLLSNRESPRGY